MLSNQHTDRTVKDDREHARVMASRLVSSCSGVGVSLEAIANSLGVSRSRVQKFADPLSHNANVSFADIVCMPPLARLVFAQALAESCGCALTTLPAEVETVNELQLVAEAQKETSDVVSVALKSFADGHASVQDATLLEHEATEGINVLLRVVRFARDVIAQRGRVLR